MKAARLAALTLVGLAPLGAHGVQFYAGLRLGGVSGFPDYAASIDSYYRAAGAAYSISTKGADASLRGVRGGAWLTDHLGIEVGYEKLGGGSGTTKVAFPPVAGQADWNVAAQARHVALLGGFSWRRNTFYAKAGRQSSSSSLETMFFADPHWASSSGNLFGAGYSFRILRHLAVSAEYENFQNVRFPVYVNQPNAPTFAKNLHTYSAGVQLLF